jgi:gluconokinase
VIIVMMGASGAGKTTVGRALAAALGWTFIEADEFHTAENIEKMRVGTGLTHLDRMPWLSAVRGEMERVARAGQSAVVACSALTAEYRGILTADLDDVHFVYLRAHPSLLKERLTHRGGHYAGPALLASQLATLEDPGSTALVLDASAPPDALIAIIRDEWRL